MACPFHGYNLEWRTCLSCDIIKLTAQGSPNFIADLSGAFDQTDTHSSNAQTAEHQTRYTAQPERPTPQVISTTYFSANHPYNFNTSNGRGGYPERFPLSPVDEKFADDFALSDGEKAENPRRRRSRLQRKSQSTSRIEANDDEEDMERIVVSDEEELQEFQYGTSLAPVLKKPGAKGRHVKFSK
jgi:hypothetical protein